MFSKSVGKISKVFEYISEYIVFIINYIQLAYYKYYHGYMYKLNINNGNVSIGLGVKYYGHKFKKDNYFDCLVGKLYKKDEEDETEFVTHYLLPHGNNILEYKGNKILVIIKKLQISDEWVYSYLHCSEIEIYLLKKNSSKANKQIIKDFLKEGVEYYEEHILDMDIESELIKTYIFDDYWETLNKRTPRKLETVHLGNIGKELLEYIKNFKKKETKEKYKERGIPYKKNILLEGMPGTGKTSLIFAVASALNMNLACINFNNKLDDNDFMRAIRKLPKNCILCLEDIDVLFKARKENDEYKSKITFSALLNTLDGLAFKQGLLCFLTTNYECNLDSALKRPGRIDKCITFTYANKQQVESMFTTFYPDKKDEFKKFYKLIRNYKFTTAILQQYFMWYMDEYESIYKEENLEEFKKISEKHDFNKKIDLYS